MAIEKNYEQIGRFIYTAYRYGGDISDVHNWMADALGIARPAMAIGTVPKDLYDAFFTRYANGDDFQANYGHFIEKMKARTQ